MPAASPVAISLPPAMSQLRNDPPFLNSILPNCKYKVPLKTATSNNILNPDIGTGRLVFAHQPFDDLPGQNEVSFSSMIGTLTQSGNFSEAFNLFEKMLGTGLRPNGFAFASLLKASSSLGGVDISRQLHGWSIRAGFGLDAGIRTALITVYSRCGMLEDARRVFDESTPSSSVTDVFLWNSILAAYILSKCWVEAFRLFVEMLSFGLVHPTELTYATIIKACGSAGEEKFGATIHGRILKDGLLEATNVQNSLVTFYANCGNLRDANQLFERIPRKNEVSWNAIIAANEQNGAKENAVDLFCRMVRIRPSLQPNRVTFLGVLSAVSGLSALKHGREIHAHVIKLELEFETSMANSLITMYSKCRNVGKARMVFDTLRSKDVITWNSMLSGYEQNEQQESCFNIFKKMQLSGIEPDSYSITILLSAASSDASRLIYLRRGQAIHGHILRRTALGGVSLSVWNAMITMYAKLDRLADAENVFKVMRKKDSYSWNAMMDGYSGNGRFDGALMIFLNMLKQGEPLDQMSLSILLTSCGRLVFLQLGKQCHSLVAKLFSDRDSASRSSFLSINNALVSMYSKCGSIDDATQVFFGMERRDVFSWTAMITGYAHHGMAFESLQLYERMKRDRIKPNHVTFLGLLMACAHGGLLKKGTHFFHSMTKDYGLKPSIEHYACMIDLFGRSGRFDSAKSLVDSGITIFGGHHGDTSSLWRVLLGSCHAHKQLELGIEAATKILELEPEDEATHITLANLYASSGLWEDAIRVRKAIRNKGLKKEVGCSWIDIGNMRHIFVAGDIFHPNRKSIYEKLRELDFRLKKIGYVPMTEFVLHDVDELQKEAIVGCHSEKLAVSFGLLQGGIGNKGVIRVIKNLRVCGDCHNWMKLTSRVERRDIILRDSRRFHFFKNGSCSCGDFW